MIDSPVTRTVSEYITRLTVDDLLRGNGGNQFMTGLPGFLNLFHSREAPGITKIIRSGLSKYALCNSHRSASS